jgi:hypothetical protein
LADTSLLSERRQRRLDACGLLLAVFMLAHERKLGALP